MAVEFINESGLKFKDISAERFRQYEYPNGRVLLIKNPTHLSVSKSGGHRIFDAQGTSWYIQPAQGWSIKWKAKEGKPNFSI